MRALLLLLLFSNICNLLNGIHKKYFSMEVFIMTIGAAIILAVGLVLAAAMLSFAQIASAVAARERDKAKCELLKDFCEEYLDPMVEVMTDMYEDMY